MELTTKLARQLIKGDRVLMDGDYYEVLAYDDATYSPRTLAPGTCEILVKYWEDTLPNPPLAVGTIMMDQVVTVML